MTEPREYPEWLITAGAKAASELGVDISLRDLMRLVRATADGFFAAHPLCPTCGGVRYEDRPEGRVHISCLDCEGCDDFHSASGVRVIVAEPVGAIDHDTGTLTASAFFPDDVPVYRELPMVSKQTEDT